MGELSVTVGSDESPLMVMTVGPRSHAVARRRGGQAHDDVLVGLDDVGVERAERDGGRGAPGAQRHHGLHRVVVGPGHRASRRCSGRPGYPPVAPDQQ